MALSLALEFVAQGKRARITMFRSQKIAARVRPFRKDLIAKAVVLILQTDLEVFSKAFCKFRSKRIGFAHVTVEVYLVAFAVFAKGLCLNIKGQDLLHLETRSYPPIFLFQADGIGDALIPNDDELALYPCRSGGMDAEIWRNTPRPTFALIAPLVVAVIASLFPDAIKSIVGEDVRDAQMPLQQG